MPGSKIVIQLALEILGPQEIVYLSSTYPTSLPYKITYSCNYNSPMDGMGDKM